MNFSERIRKKRKELGYKGFEFAKKVGINAPYLCQIERYGRVPSVKIALKLAKALGEDPKEYVLWSVKARIEPEARPYLDSL